MLQHQHLYNLSQTVMLLFLGMFPISALLYSLVFPSMGMLVLLSGVKRSIYVEKQCLDLNQ